MYSVSGRRLRAANVARKGGDHRNLTILPIAYNIENRLRMSVPKTDIDGGEYRDLYSGLIRLHILHHAVEGPIFGLAMAEELARHGYRISLGTLYPLLHGLEKKGYLRSAEKRNGRSIRKVYRATSLGRKALQA